MSRLIVYPGHLVGLISNQHVLKMFLLLMVDCFTARQCLFFNKKHSKHSLGQVWVASRGVIIYFDYEILVRIATVLPNVFI